MLSYQSSSNLICKLIELKKVELLQRSSGREYVTHARLMEEIKDIIRRHGGRTSVFEIQRYCDVSIDHVEEKISILLKQDPTISRIDTDIITEDYLIGIAEKINDKLQADGELGIMNLAQEFKLSVAFLVKHITSHLGKTIHGQVEGMHLYTGEFVIRLKAKIRGIMNAVTSPVSIENLCKKTNINVTMALREIKELEKSKNLIGTVSGGQRAIYTPRIFNVHQQIQLDQMWKTDGYMAYSWLKEQLKISKPGDFMKKRYPTAMILPTFCVAERFVSQATSTLLSCIASKSFANLEMEVQPPMSTEEASVFIAKMLDKVCGTAKSRSLRQMQKTYVVSEGFLHRKLDLFKDFINNEAKKAIQKTFLKEQPQQIQIQETTALTARDRKKARQKGGSGGAQRGQQRKEKKMRSKKGKKNKDKDFDSNARRDFVDSSETLRSGSKKAKGGMHSQMQPRRGGGKRRQATVSVRTGDVIEVLKSNWEGELDVSLLVEVASTLRPRINTMVTKAINKLSRLQGANRIIDEEVTKHLQELYDHMSVYSTSIAILRGKNKEIEQKDEPLVLLLRTFLLRTLGCKVVDFLLNNEIATGSVALPGEEKEKIDPNSFNYSEPRTWDQRTNLALALKEGKLPMGAAISDMLTTIRLRDSKGFLRAFMMAADIVSLKLWNVDGKKFRNLVFHVRRAIMLNLANENDPQLVFQHCILILHSQLTSGILHVPAKFVSQVIPLLKDDISQDVFSILERVQTLLAQGTKLDDHDEKLELLLLVKKLKKIGSEPKKAFAS
eukprot:CAMPEP_0167758962 /NCGR_PEP_ID=MMETSP0110_2-20121227/10761_1 /TAXON_ID=629695 /ORGANISM="Gymnochlora sp., Strain CCMP2014" /LENGTH=781 /DNA_ID=CAMNT_0007645299 /DNA_START=55 /DNA_END=2400 /DNA_ORIENTATION=+